MIHEYMELHPLFHYCSCGMWFSDDADEGTAVTSFQNHIVEISDGPSRLMPPGLQRARRPIR